MWTTLKPLTVVVARTVGVVAVGRELAPEFVLAGSHGGDAVSGCFAEVDHHVLGPAGGLSALLLHVGPDLFGCVVLDRGAHPALDVDRRAETGRVPEASPEDPLQLAFPPTSIARRRGLLLRIRHVARPAPATSDAVLISGGATAL